MIYLIHIILANSTLYCNRSQFFAGIPTENNTFMKLSISKPGIESFIDNCIDDMLGMLSMIQFGVLDLEALGFQVRVSDITVADINLQNYSLSMSPNQSFVNINNINVIFQGHIQIQQKTFPYINIDTIGKVEGVGVNLQVLCNLKPSDECPDHLKFSVLNLKAEYQSIQILADDLLMFQSLIPFIADQLLASLGTVLLQPFLDRINGYLYNMSGDMVSGDLVFDQRISNVMIDQAGIVVDFVGLTPNGLYKHGKNTINKRNYSNDQIQYQANVQIIRDMIQMQCPDCAIQIVNCGILLSIPDEDDILLTLDPVVTAHGNDKLMRVVSMYFRGNREHPLIDKLNESPYAFFSVYPGDFFVLYQNDYQHNMDGSPLEEVIVLASFKKTHHYGADTIVTRN